MSIPIDLRATGTLAETLSLWGPFGIAAVFLLIFAATFFQERRPVERWTVFVVALLFSGVGVAAWWYRQELGVSEIKVLHRSRAGAPATLGEHDFLHASDPRIWTQGASSRRLPNGDQDLTFRLLFVDRHPPRPGEQVRLELLRKNRLGSAEQAFDVAIQEKCTSLELRASIDTRLGPDDGEQAFFELLPGPAYRCGAAIASHTPRFQVLPSANAARPEPPTRESAGAAVNPPVTHRSDERAELQEQIRRHTEEIARLRAQLEAEQQPVEAVAAAPPPRAAAETVVVEPTGELPAPPAPSATTVVYYSRPLDEDRVAGALDGLYASWVRAPSTLSRTRSNTLWHGDGVSQAEVRALARQLCDAGVRLRFAGHFGRPGYKVDRIEIGFSSYWEAQHALGKAEDPCR